MALEEILASHRTGRPALMGVLNVTPDSFSDGGQFVDPAAARDRAGQMIVEGADVIDIGAESTRPGSDRVPAGQQIDRLKDILPAVAAAGAIVSIDTTLSAVAEFALDAGAQIVNDVSAGRDDPELLPLAASRGAAVVLMHMLGEPKTMQADPRYDDVVSEVRDFLAGRLEAAVASGVRRDRIILDPGIGFGKLLEHNLALVANVKVLTELGCPVLVGPSRKRFIGEIAGELEAAGRVAGTIAACLAARRGGATILRVHDVREVAAALAVDGAIESSRPVGKSGI